MRQAIADWLNGPDTVVDRVESGRPVPRGIDPGALAAASGFRGRESQRPTDRAVLLSLGRDFVALLARSRQHRRGSYTQTWSRSSASGRGPRTTMTQRLHEKTTSDAFFLSRK